MTVNSYERIDGEYTFSSPVLTIDALLSSDNASHGVSLDPTDEATGLIGDASDRKYAIGDVPTLARTSPMAYR